MKMMTAMANLEGRHTNHSACLMMIITLRHVKINPLGIFPLLGHKNLKSINSYSTVSEEQQKKMSLIISDRSLSRTSMKPVISSDYVFDSSLKFVAIISFQLNFYSTECKQMYA